jgi:hypothetical protein
VIEKVGKCFLVVVKLVGWGKVLFYFRFLKSIVSLWLQTYSNPASMSFLASYTLLATAEQYSLRTKPENTPSLSKELLECFHRSSVFDVLLLARKHTPK